MPKASMLTYAILSGATPALVLINTLLGTEAASSSSVQPFQPLRLVEGLMNSGPASLVTADDLMPDESASRSNARIIAQNNHYILEFYNPFSTAAQTPNLMLVLEPASAPSENFTLSDRHHVISKLRADAGKQQYLIPNSVDVSQYLSVVLWCPEFNVIMGYASLTFGM
ncbi:MAG: DM13 domain-containing protein [Leptolyngbya sp. SIO1D8]|nr:DM13 domain-containing protein [Leptolyngbya sp. SIO1D8]